MFAPLDAKFDFPAAESRVLAFWREHDIFSRSLAQRADAPPFVFYEGPPTANGMPHPGHALTRAMKDVFPRYQTMCGRRVDRKAGWDTHGLPVEVEVCKQLGIHSKDEIEAYGLEPFVRKCVESVWRYTRQWEEMTSRLGFWINLDEAYATYHQSYVESVWWSLKSLFERGLLYQGYKVVWWWAQGGTALSSGEVGEGYRTVDDPSVYVRFPLLPAGSGAAAIRAQETARGASGASLLVWTTTPWTLLSNHFAAVHADLDYSLVHDPELGENLYIASELVEAIGKKVKRELEPIATCKGSDLIGARYTPPFPDVYYNRTPQDAAFRPNPSDATDVDDLGWIVPPSANVPLGELTQPLKDGGAAPIGWRVVAADFVTIDSGTGIVHEAPPFGEVDFNLLRQEAERFTPHPNGQSPLPVLCAVRPNGMFRTLAGEKVAGRWVKEADKDISRDLRERGLLYHLEQYRHEYPFCPRAEDDALIQYARRSWFVRTSQFKDEFLANNDKIYWLPEHIKEGRFGDFLRNNVDWALSRERYWGTPLPIWQCEQTGRMEPIGSYEELKTKPGVSGFEAWEQAKAAEPSLVEDLKVHRPYIDAVSYDSPFAPGARMRRVIEVIDCWWDAGSMPFAQWGYPHKAGSVETFNERFPADFISEAIDQTRGWFYALLAINTLLQKGGAFKQNGTPDAQYPLPYRTCIVLGHMNGEDGLKMSKRLKNYREPSYIFDTLGADAMRWYFYSAQTPWTSVRFQEAAIRDAQRDFLVRLYNVFSFFNIYANIDGFEPDLRLAGAPEMRTAARDSAAPLSPPECRSTGWRPAAQRGELDRWILSELHRTIERVRGSMDRFENYPAAGTLNAFVDALSNWYVRRSRDRFWKSAKDHDKWDAYNTLYECLLTLSQMIAPFTPFLAETIYQNLTRGDFTTRPAGDDATNIPLSVHLCDYPVAEARLVDERLASEMEIVREIASLGRAARTQAKIKVRQPLAQVEIVLANHTHEQWLAAHASLICEELNVKQVEFTSEADHYVTYQVKPDFKALGPKYGKKAPQIAKALQSLDAAAGRRELVERGFVSVTVDGETLQLTEQEVQIRLDAKEGWSAAQGRVGVVVLKTDLTDELRAEGLVRELIHHVQAARKEQDLAYEARIRLQLAGPAELIETVRAHESVLRSECLIEQVDYNNAASDATAVDVEGHAAKLKVTAI